MFGKRSLGRTHIPHRKNTAKLSAVEMTPEEVWIPTMQHIGAPAIVTVKVGDEVRIGDRIAEASAPVSSHIYASVSGKVTKIEDYLRPDGRKAQAVRIQSDGKMEWANVKPPVVNTLDELVAAARECGLVGLGGAGFPTDIKLSAAKRGNIRTLVINAAECEPYITTDTRTMLEHGESILEGALLLLSLIPSLEQVIIGIEKNKPAAIRELDRLFDGEDKVKVKALPALYPQGAEKMIIYNTTGIVVKEGKLPADHGVLVVNVTTLVTLTEYLHTGKPLVSRSLTVDGPAVSEPKNVTAPIGTSIGDILAFVGVDPDQTGKVLFGGPMMGVAIANDGEPITKTTNALTVMRKCDSLYREHTACIRCGRCVAYCPMGLNPTVFAKALDLEIKEDKVKRLEEYKVELCMECGCCSYVCPAGRPLVQNNRMGKAEVREHRAHRATLK